MKQVVIVLMAGVGALATFALPTEAEIAKVTPVVQELAKGDYAALKAGRRSPEQVAETLLGYVKDAESEAAKYVLLCKAFDLYLEHGPLSKARDVANKLMPAHVKNCSLNGFNERLGCALAAKDQWNYAFMAFNRCGGKMAEIVAWEKSYPETGITELTTGAVGDFWWELSEKHADSPKVAAALRAHAVRWYKEALKNNSLRGLKKTLAEKRIAEVEKDGGSASPSAGASRVERSSGNATEQASDKERVPSQNSYSELEKKQAAWTASAAVKIAKPADKPITLNLGKGAKIEFIGCPAGEFMMGDRYAMEFPESLQWPHKVTITRPFWLAKYKTTHEMWNAYQKVQLTQEDKLLGGMRRAHVATRPDIEGFCDWLTKKNRRALPAGYVFRIPTEAEWEYACRTDNVDDLHAKYLDSRIPGFAKPKEFSKIVVWWEDEVEPIVTKAKLPCDPQRPDASIGRRGGVAVGTKQPNAWGLYDMLGLGEATLDVVDVQKCKKIEGDSLQRQTGLEPYKEHETDPLRWDSNTLAPRIFRRGGNVFQCWRMIAGIKYQDPVKVSVPFRVCIGPDLIKEKGFKKIDWSRIKGQSSSGGNSKRK